MGDYPATFSAWFPKENISLVYSINCSNFIVCFPLLRKILGNVYFNCLLTRLRRDKFRN